jgi:hypothetical protein
MEGANESDLPGERRAARVTDLVTVTKEAAERKDFQVMRNQLLRVIDGENS